MTNLPAPYSPQETLRAFPGSVEHLMPDMEDIPEEFLRSSSIWVQLQRDWFFNGVQDAEFHPKPFVDAEMAYYHLLCIQGSFGPTHQHKQAAVAYLASLWFVKVILDGRTYE